MSVKRPLHGFGSTFEEYYKLTYGLKQRGSPRDRPFDHKSGKGYVAPHKGHYHDALYVKKLRVVILLIEALGGMLHRRGRTSLTSPAARRAEARPTAPNMAARASPPSPSTCNTRR